MPQLAVSMVKQLIKYEQHTKAFELIKATLKKHPETDDLYLQLTQLAQIDNRSIYGLLDHISQQFPDNALAHSAMAQMYIQSGSWKEAQIELEKALSIQFSVLDCLALADVLQHQGLPKKLKICLIKH